MNSENPNPYADIIDLPHHVSKRHPQMPMEKRAAQFSPFAAMVGHDAAIRETARLTEERLELSEDEKAVIDGKLQMIKAHIKEQPEVTVTYFHPDKKKSGGAYVTVTGSAKKVDNVSKLLLLQDGRTIPIKDIQLLQNLSG
ncbi:MAG: hypothetical protein IKO94_08680 [Selenomonadaceae bacterium]|nr:hypothetical protein [Selenomonadaceae bacterium]